jgi:6-phosphogluconolactonase
LSFVPGRPLAVLLSELASTLTLLEVTGEGTFRPWQILSTLPEGFKGENLGGHLALNAAGTRVYVSNRGHNSLAVFGLEGRSMELIGHVASMGEHPRHFALLEDAGQLVVAHEKDGHVAAFRIAADGRLTHAGDGLALPGACCVIA